jgi:hypothetical protein
MGKLKESIIVSSEHNDFAANESIDYQCIIDLLIEGATAFNMLSEHCPVDEKHYFLEKRDDLLNTAQLLALTV